MSELPTSMKLFLSLLVGVIVLSGLGLFFNNKPNNEVSKEFLELKYSSEITKDDLNKIMSNETSPVEIQRIIRKSEQSFDLREKGTIVEDYIREDISDKDLKENTYVLVTYDKRSESKKEILEILENMKVKKLVGELVIIYDNIPESNLVKTSIQDRVSNGFQKNDDINTLGVEYLYFKDIVVLEKGKLVYETDDFMELTDRKNKLLYR